MATKEAPKIDLGNIDYAALMQSLLQAAEQEAKDMWSDMSEEDKTLYLEIVKDYATLQFQLMVEKDEDRRAAIEKEKKIAERSLRNLKTIASMKFGQAFLSILGKSIAIIAKGALAAM
jgi:hypothetical protein